MLTCLCGCEKIPTKGKRFIWGHNSKIEHSQIIHGDAKKGQIKRLHNIWRGMLKRCNSSNINLHGYKSYAGKGIRVCDEWMNYISFREWAIKNGWDENDLNLTIDRINCDIGYSPLNCRFAIQKVQQRNRTNNQLLESNGERKTAAEWAELARMPYANFYYHAILKRKSFLLKETGIHWELKEVA